MQYSMTKNEMHLQLLPATSQLRNVLDAAVIVFCMFLIELCFPAWHSVIFIQIHIPCKFQNATPNRIKLKTSIFRKITYFQG